MSKNSPLAGLASSGLGGRALSAYDEWAAFSDSARPCRVDQPADTPRRLSSIGSRSARGSTRTPTHGLDRSPRCNSAAVASLPDKIFSSGDDPCLKRFSGCHGRETAAQRMVPRPTTRSRRSALSRDRTGDFAKPVGGDMIGRRDSSPTPARSSACIASS